MDQREQEGMDSGESCGDLCVPLPISSMALFPTMTGFKTCLFLLQWADIADDHRKGKSHVAPTQPGPYPCQSGT